MKSHVSAWIGVLAAIITVSSEAESTVTRSSGGSIRTHLGYGIVVNKESSLEREWVVVNDNNLPLRIIGNAGVKTFYERGEGRYSQGRYNYAANVTLEATASLSAFEIRLITFNVWGDRVKTLSASMVMDVKQGEKRTHNWKWNVFSENEVSECFASITYVATVRTVTDVC